MIALSDVLLVDRSTVWCREVEALLGVLGASARWTATFPGVERSLKAQAADGVLIDLDLFETRERLEIVQWLTHASPAPAVVAWASELSVREAFELGRLGVRELRRERPDPGRAARLLMRALEAPPMIEPHLRAMVGHVSQPELMQLLKDVTVDQALGAARGNKTKASELLRISRQAVAHNARPIEEAS